MTRIAYLEDRIQSIEAVIEEARQNGNFEDTVDEQVELAELRDKLNFAWQDDEAEYLYAVERQEFNPDGSLVY